MMLRGLPVRTVGTLAAGLTAAGVLLAGGRHVPPAPPVGRLPMAQAWPGAARATFPELLVSPLLFLNATTVVGTLPTRDARHLRLVVESSGGAPRELRRVSSDADPQFSSVTAVGGQLIWAEVAQHRPWRIWVADLAGGPARRLVADAGAVAFPGDQYDLVVAQARVYWVTSPAERATEIRSVPLTGGSVDVRAQAGEWSLSAWPWLADGASVGLGTTRLHDLNTGREVRVATSAASDTACTPTWCRIMVTNAGGDLVGIDVMHPGAADRRRIAGGGARAAVTDVAVLDRFVILSEPLADSDLTGSAGLLVYDITTSRTVTIAAAASSVHTHDGMLWWSTGEVDLTWHTLDLRTV